MIIKDSIAIGQFNSPLEHLVNQWMNKVLMATGIWSKEVPFYTPEN